MSLFTLFLTFLQIGTFSIGGGYAIIAMISEQVVTNQHWISAREFSDIITISQMTPGPLAVNTSTFVGMRIAGMMGAITATLGCICMGVILSYGIYHIFQRFSASRIMLEVLKGLKAGSLGLIMAAASILIVLAFFQDETLSIQTLRIPAVFLFALILFISRKWKWNPIVLMLLSGGLGILLYA